MKIGVIGNGILGTQTAYRLLKDDPSLRIEILGPSAHPGCASLAAAAMFNSFCEVESGTLKNSIERQKFLFNKLSNPLWPGLLKEIEEKSGVKLDYGFGTYLINNNVSDSLEDANFDAVIEALKEFNEPHEMVRPSDIPFYKPASARRAGRALFIPREGWVNPLLLMEALKTALQKSGRVEFIDGSCTRLITGGNGSQIESAESSNGKKMTADVFVLCPGANFSQIVNNSKLPLEFIRIFYGVGATILLNTAENTIKNCIRTPNRGLACGIYAAPQGKDHTIVGASNFIAPVPVPHARLTSVYTLLKAAMEQINSDYYRSDLVRVNVGWRPTSADTLPLIGKTGISNLIVVTGTKRDGLHCSPVISEAVSELLLKGRTKYDLLLFNPHRKPTKIYTREEAIKMAVAHSLNAAYQHDFVPAKNRMVDHLEQFYTKDFSDLHDKVGARDWGIPPEMMDMYRYGHIQ